MKKLFFIVLILIGITSMPINSYASEDITIYFFRGDTCPHCESSLNYLNEHKEEIPDNIKIVTYEVYNNSNNEKLHEEVAKKLGVTGDDLENVPFIAVGNKYRIGMDGIKSDFDELMSLAQSVDNSDYTDVVASTIKEMKKEDKSFKVKAITLEKLYAGPNKTVTIVAFAIFGVIIIGFLAMVLFPKKS